MKEEIMDFYKIIEIIKEAFRDGKKIEIYYPKTENREKGWRKITPINITTDIPPDGETLVVEKDRLSPGHILNATDEKNNNTKKEQTKSFIIGKIRKAKINKS